MSDGAAAGQRIDKWLWHARAVRTRSLAQKLVETGGVRVNRDKIAASSRLVRPGDVLTLALPGGVRIWQVVGLAERRGSFTQASALYRDIGVPRSETPGADEPGEAGGPVDGRRTGGAASQAPAPGADEPAPSRDDRRARAALKRGG